MVALMKLSRKYTDGLRLRPEEVFGSARWDIQTVCFFAVTSELNLFRELRPNEPGWQCEILSLQILVADIAEIPRLKRTRSLRG